MDTQNAILIGNLSFSLLLSSSNQNLYIFAYKWEGKNDRLTYFLRNLLTLRLSD